jgi:hypothetical protein
MPIKTMKKKLLYPLIGLFALLVIAVSILLITRKSSKESSDAIRAIPIDAAVVIRINSISEIADQLYGKNSFWNALGSFSLVSQVNDFFEYSQQNLKQSSLFEQVVLTNQVFISVHGVGKGTPATLFLTNIPERLKPADISVLAADLITDQYRVEEKEYNGARIFTATHKTDETANSFSFAIHLNVVSFSQSLHLVESAVGQLGSGVSLINDKAFVDAISTAGTKINLNVLVNHAKIPAAFSLQIHPSQRSGFEWLANTSRWTELDLSVKDDAFYLNGFAQVSDSINSFYRVFAKQKPVKIGVTRVLPAQTAAFITLGISNLTNYLSSYREFLEKKGSLNAYNVKINRFNQAVGFNIAELYSSFFGTELALTYIPFEGEKYGDCWFVVAEAQSQSLARQELTQAIEKYARKSNLSSRSFEKDFAVDREKSVKIYKFPLSGMHTNLFGGMFEIANDQYFTFIDSYVVFGSSVESLSRLILANIHNKQLAVEQSFVEFSQSLATESNFTAFISPAKAEVLYGQILQPSTAARILSRTEAVSKIQGVALQLTGGKKMIFNNIATRYTPYSVDAPQTVWESRLDTIITMKPQLVINHNTQNREIFVQDIKNNIYLINDIGRVLWRRPLPEPILGEVNQVDVFRNGRLQYIFNTRSHLYLIDRNGNNVSGFPVVLRSSATNPVAVFDYDNNRDYRFFIAGEDRSILVYNRQGNIVTGWDFDKTEKHVTQPIQHFQHGGRDYIVFADANRLYFLDRRGNERIRLSQIFAKAPHSSIALETTSNRATRFVTTDTLGVVKFISTDGMIQDKLVKSVSPNHFFDFQDVDADGSNDFILLDGNELSVYKSDGKLLFSTKFKDEPLPNVFYFHFGARDRKLGVTCPESSQIFLINGDGSLYKGFPLKGITPFSIGRFANTKSTFNLITGSRSGYVLNYAVQ